MVDSTVRLQIPGHYPQFDLYTDLANEKGDRVARMALAAWLMQIGFEQNYRMEAMHYAEAQPLLLVDEVLFRMKKQILNRGVIHNGIGWFRKVLATVSRRVAR